MRPNFLLLVVLVVGALGVSWLLIPRQEELALIQYKSAQYEEARLAYEEQIAAGDYSAAVVAPLADIYLFYGEPEAAIRIVERFVAQRPADVGALRLLAKYSRDAQQWDGYRHALERIVALAPEEQPVRDLLARYRIAGDHARVRDMLALLVERRYATGPDYEALAQLQAAQGNYAAAVVTLQEQFELLPDTMTVTAIQLWTSLLLDIDDIDGALARARQWLERNPDAGSTLQLVYLLSGRGQKAPALALLDRIDGDEREATDTLAARIGLEIDLGRRADAWPRLQRLHREDRLPSGLIVAYVDVALSQGDLDAAFAEAARHPPERLPGGLLVAMILTAQNGGRSDLAYRLFDRLDERFLAGEPVLAVRLELARGDPAAAGRWADRALARDGLSLDQRLELATQLVQLGRRDNAIDLLSGVVRSEAVPPAVYGDIARLYLDLDRVGDGLALFAELRRQRTSAAADAAWARLALAAGDVEAVAGWLAGVRTGDVQLLQDLYYGARDRGARVLAAAAARRLHALDPGVAGTTIFAESLVADGEAARAADLLRPLFPADRELRRVYLDALIAAGDAERLAAVLGTVFDLPGVDEDERSALLYRVLDTPAAAAALPELRTRAVGRGGDWYFGYVAAAKRAGRTDELVGFLEEELARTDLDPGQLDARLYALFEERPAAALAAAERLSRRDPDRHLDAYIGLLQQAGDAPALTVALKRALDRRLPPERREAYLYALIETGGPREALPHVRRQAEAAGGVWLGVLEDLLGRLQLDDELNRLLVARATAAGTPPEERRNVAFRLLERNQRSAAEQAFRSLAATAPPDGPDVSQLLYLWGPRPGIERIRWIERRALDASGPARAAWMRHLVSKGAAEAAIRLYDTATPAAARRGPVLLAYLEAIVAADGGQPSDRLRGAVEAALGRDGLDAATLMQLGDLAEGSGRPDLAIQAYEGALAEDDGRHDALRRLARLHFFADRDLPAERYFARYLDLEPGDSEANFLYAELLRADGRGLAAQGYYRRARDRLDAVPPAERDFQYRRSYATVLFRLGFEEQALAEYRRLVDEHPADRELKADYASVLLESGRLRRASEVLRIR